jgi:hypothetical protein
MGANTNAPIILSIMGFYVVIGVLLGLFGSSYQASATIDHPANPDTISFLEQIDFFFTGMTFTIASLPAWATTLLFLPLGITMFYIILSWLRGSS